jgi:hypothetical protein
MPRALENEAHIAAQSTHAQPMRRVHAAADDMAACGEAK